MKKKEDKKDQKKEKKEPEEIEICCKEREEYLNGWRREKANFINFKKEETERVQALLEYRLEVLISEIIPIIDNFENAEKNIPEEERNDNGYIKGLLMIKRDLNNFLKNQGVEEMECMGEIFDPNFHEAIETVESDEKSGVIVEEVAKGYKIKNKVLRPAKVKVIK